MTLGNSPKPLTRRQLRELAKAQEPASADGEAVQPAAEYPNAHSHRTARPKTKRAEDPKTRPAAAKPNRAPDAPAAATFAELIHQKSDAPDSSPPVSAFAKRPVEPAQPAAAPTPTKRPAVERTLTRRQLREMKAASAEVEVVDLVDLVDLGGSKEPDAVPLPDEADQPGALNPPVGHWSVDREEDVHTQTIALQPFNQLMSRGNGAGGIPTTTNALILPAIPRRGTASGPLTSTGEVMVTGSFDLPRSLGETGQHPNTFDSSEMDQMLDQLDEGGHNSNVSPVSASRAVSTHTSTRGVMTPPKTRSASLPTVLAISVGVLALSVLALFVLGYVFKIF